MQRERQVWVVGWSDRAIANILYVQYVLLAWLVCCSKCTRVDVCVVITITLHATVYARNGEG